MRMFSRRLLGQPRLSTARCARRMWCGRRACHLQRGATEGRNAECSHFGAIITCQTMFRESSKVDAAIFCWLNFGRGCSVGLL